MSDRHGVAPRGLMSTPRSPSFEGRFGRMFRTLPRAKFGATDPENVENLAGWAAPCRRTSIPQGRKGRRGERHSRALHLPRAVHRSRHHLRSGQQPAEAERSRRADDFRTPAFDLDNVYGRGPRRPAVHVRRRQRVPARRPDPAAATRTPRTCRATTPILAARSSGIRATTRTRSFRSSRGCFCAFTIGLLRGQSDAGPFAEVQKLVRFHYQYVVLNDFLPRIVHSSVLAAAQDRRALRSGTSSSSTTGSMIPSCRSSSRWRRTGSATR